MGKRSRDKGKRGEREACDVLRPVFPQVRRRAMQARGGTEGADLDGTPGWHVEVGVGRNVSPLAKLEQAIGDQRTYEESLPPMFRRSDVPIALCKRDRGEWTVTMRASDWVNLVWVRQRAEDLPEAQGEGRGR